MLSNSYAGHLKQNFGEFLCLPICCLCEFERLKFCGHSVYLLEYQLVVQWYLYIDVHIHLQPGAVHL
jgi:hypothetical protein